MFGCVLVLLSVGGNWYVPDGHVGYILGDIFDPHLEQIYHRNKKQNAGLKTGTYGSGIWVALIDKLCIGVSCDAHCKLNKDAPGVNRLIFNPCDGNIQKDAYYGAESRAISSTIYHLDKFCRNAPNLCR